MSSKSEKEIRKEIQNRLEEKEKADFLNSLPMDKELFHELFDYLDERLEVDCDHTLKMTLTFLNENKIKDSDNVIKWLNDKGGYCDCEVLSNVEELFE